jgi:hypothetical protein
MAKNPDKRAHRAKAQKKRSHHSNASKKASSTQSPPKTTKPPTDDAVTPSPQKHELSDKQKKKTKKKKQKKESIQDTDEFDQSNNVATPPSAQSKRSTTSVLRDEVKKLKVGSGSKSLSKKAKIHRPTDASDRVHAHAIKWQTENGLNDALVVNFPTLKKNERKSMSYHDKLVMLVGLYSPKDLLSAFGLICISKGVDFANINTTVEFATSVKAQKIFIDTCMIPDDVVSIKDSSDDESDNSRYVVIPLLMCSTYYFLTLDLCHVISATGTNIKHTK